MFIRVRVGASAERAVRCLCARRALGGTRASGTTVNANAIRVFRVLTIFVANRADAIAPAVRLSFS